MSGPSEFDISELCRELEQVRQERDEARVWARTWKTMAKRLYSASPEADFDWLSPLPPNRRVSATMTLVSRGRGLALPIDDFEQQEGVLEWSDQPPTESGWYWYRECESAVASYVVRIAQGISSLVLMALVGGSQTVIASEQKGQWAGPLTPPEGK